MTYASEQAAISRTPVQLVRITADYCDRTFGTSPCLATGTKCYNTFGTCVYTTAYLNTTGKEYKFTSADVPPPFNTGERPYLMDVRLLPTEVKEVRTVLSRATITIADEPDGDVGIDPYVSSRSSVQGTYWRKWLARNKHYKGRQIEVLDGFDSITEANFVSKFRGTIESIALGNGRVVIEAVDYVHDLTKILWPPKVDVRLTFDITASTAYVYVDNIDELQSPSGYIKVNDEVIGYTVHNPTAKFVSGLTRGASGTTAAAHDEGDKVVRMGYVAEDYISDHIVNIFTQAGIPTSEYDVLDLFQIWADPDLDLPQTELLVADPTPLSEWVAQLAELSEVLYWVGEDTKLQFTRKLPNFGGRSFVATLTDEANIVQGSVSVRLGDDTRITRFEFSWVFNLFGDADDRDDYLRRELVIDADAESATEYNEEAEHVVLSPIMRQVVSYTTQEDHYRRVVNYLKRYVWFNREARPVVKLRVELKDGFIKTGDFVRVSTREMQDRNGDDWSNVECQVTKRERVGMQVELTLRQLPPRRIAYVAPDATPVWASADADDKQYAFISDDAPNLGKMDNENNDGYYIV